MPYYCCINGHIFPAKGASIGINDLGLLRGYAAFELLRTYKGLPFHLNEHLQRFRSSASELHLPVNFTDNELKNTIYELLKLSEISEGKEAMIRFILTGGYAPDGISISDPNLIISVEDAPQYPPEIYENGVKLISWEFQREMARSKTTDYLMAVQLQPLRKKHNAFDVLYCKDGEVLEVTRNNFFLFKKDVLITPKDGILQGITRQIVLELAKDHFTIEERKTDVTELWQADEAFLTGTTKKVVPVVTIDDIQIGYGIPGKNTGKMMELFDEYVMK